MATVALQYSLVDTQNRDPLREGRSRGMGFAFCKLEGTVATTVMALSACKDYLSDQVYSEITGKPYTAYGFTSKKQDIFKDGIACLAFGVLKEKHGVGASSRYGEYIRYAAEVENLRENLPNMQRFMNWFEEQMKLDGRTELVAAGDNRYLALFPTFWVKAVYLISAYSLLLRISQNYKEGDVLEFAAKGGDSDEVYYMGYALPKIKRILAGEVPEQQYGSNIHDAGIINFRFP
jgi:hypothetical protein